MSVAVEKNTATEFKQSIAYHVTYSLGTTIDRLNARQMFQAVALATRDRMIDSMLETERRYDAAGAKRVYYLSMEFLIGRSLVNNLTNLNLMEACEQTVSELGFHFHEIVETEVDAALGNGGLGRLAACFLDSIATLGLPGYGYGINYEYGLFRQEIVDGEQYEKPDNWRTFETPWEIERPQEAVFVPLYGRLEHARDRSGGYNPMWLDWQIVVGVPHDMPIVGYTGKTVNYLRLYTARASQEVDMNIFNEGDYVQAVRQKVLSETISKVLYPRASDEAGMELRLIQEYFLVACAVQDIMRQYFQRHNTLDQLPNQVAIQLNDTHPALAVLEMMRIFIDEHDLPWDKAWDLNTKIFAYTNHTLMPEALEKWPVHMLERVLPRHLQLMYEINSRFLKVVMNKWPDDPSRMQRLSLIEEGTPKQARMAHLSIVGSHSVNGVAAVHSELVKTRLVPDFYELWPEKFNSKTNGVTQRRWLLACNPGLSRLATERVGDGWTTNLDKLRDLLPLAKDTGFQDEFMKVKHENKRRMADVIRQTVGETVDENSMFDVQIKRIHEYKRQLLNILHVVHAYLSIVEDGQTPVPRTVIFGGKAAPGYIAAKQIIKVINDVAKVVNNDPRANQYLKVAFVPDYKVTLAEVMIPSADLSEQISAAGNEASGTGNMKFAINGAITIGTLDGANIEIREEVGDENIFIFGLTVPEVHRLLSAGYKPWDYCRKDDRIRRVMEAFRDGRFCPEDPSRHNWVFHKLLTDNERYVHLADLGSYIDAQDQASALYLDKPAWAEKAIHNTARMGKFSSDRTIAQYAEEIWDVKPVV